MMEEWTEEEEWFVAVCEMLVAVAIGIALAGYTSIKPPHRAFEVQWILTARGSYASYVLKEGLSETECLAILNADPSLPEYLALNDRHDPKCEHRDPNI
jgi:hypothetical protein